MWLKSNWGPLLPARTQNHCWLTWLTPSTVQELIPAEVPRLRFMDEFKLVSTAARAGRCTKQAAMASAIKAKSRRDAWLAHRLFRPFIMSPASVGFPVVTINGIFEEKSQDLFLNFCTILFRIPFFVISWMLLRTHPAR